MEELRKEKVAIAEQLHQIIKVLVHYFNYNYWT